MKTRVRSLALWLLALGLFIPLGLLVDDVVITDYEEIQEEFYELREEEDLSAAASAFKVEPDLRSEPNAAGERLLLCSFVKGGYTLFLERSTGERLLCRHRAEGLFDFENLPDCLQWVEDRQDAALLHCRDENRSTLLLFELRDDGGKERPLAPTRVLLEVTDGDPAPQLRLRGNEADWLRADGSVAATFYLNAPAEAAEAAEAAEPLAPAEPLGGLFYASAPNSRGKRVGLLTAEVDDHYGVAVLEPGKEPYEIVGSRRCALGHRDLGATAESRAFFGWLSELCFYSCCNHSKRSTLRLHRLERTPQGLTEPPGFELMLLYEGRFASCREEGGSLVLRAEDGRPLMRMPLRK